MLERSNRQPEGRGAAKSRRGPGPLKSFWRKIRKPLMQSRLSKNILASVLAKALRFTYWTNPRVKGSADLAKAYREHAPAIVALWHGQHLLAPCGYPRNIKLVAMISRSADAEMNAMVFEKLGFQAARGSGGRDGVQNMDKGGASALIALKKALDTGSTVAMIADIPHGTPREAGLGVVTLARLSGRPVVPVAVATSRRKVLERTWDKTTINLPFGRAAIVLGEAINVPSAATDDDMEMYRQQVTQRLNQATAEAYRLVDGVQ